MRLALATSPLVVASLLFACTTFSDANDEPPPPDGSDAGQDTAPPADECVPVVVAPDAPAECSDDLKISASNCGTCGHACVDAQCVDGTCVPERITQNEVSVFALDGTSLYLAIGSDIQRVDLTQHPTTIEPFFQGIFGTMTHLEAYAGELYVSTTQQPTIVNIGSKQQRGNEHFPPLNTNRGDGRYFPGKIAYYLYPFESGYDLARIDTSNDSVSLKSAMSFEPVARSGDELFFTERLTNGAQIWGTWDQKEKPVAVGGGIQAFAADGKDAFVVGGGFVRRARSGTLTDVAVETGEALSMAVAGSDLYYLVKRSTPGEDRYQVYRVDKCRGGRPVLLYESVNTPATRIVPDGPAHVLVSTQLGIFRAR